MLPKLERDLNSLVTSLAVHSMVTEAPESVRSPIDVLFRSGLPQSEALLRRDILEAQVNPLPFLLENKDNLSGRACSEIGLRIADELSGLPLLRADVRSEGPSGPVVLLANTGGQLSNSAVYLGQSEAELRLVREHEESTLSQMIGFSRPGDTFVASSENPVRMHGVLTAIAQSYRQAGLELASDFQFVDSITNFVASSSTAKPVLPAVLVPELFEACVSDASASDVARSIALANVAAYTKHGAERWWAASGLPTPQTEYLDLGRAGHVFAAEALQARFAEYSELVINTTGGSGGHSIHKIKRTELSPELLQELFGSDLIQAQGLLDVKSSPCIIASIDDESAQVLGVSIQKFNNGFGVHSGNYWNPELWTRLGIEYPDFFRVTQSALESLREGGVRGQVNIDVMCIDKAESERRGLGSQAILREANIRPAGSSVFLRLREGSIDGNRVEQISSVTGVKISVDADSLRSILSAVEELRTPGQTQAVLYSVNPVGNTCSIAFVASDSCSLDNLLDFERNVLERIAR